MNRTEEKNSHILYFPLQQLSEPTYVVCFILLCITCQLLLWIFIFCQEKIFSDLGQVLLDNAWLGYNCCLFAYGQTGSGKSYSVFGYGQNKGKTSKPYDIKSFRNGNNFWSKDHVGKLITDRVIFGKLYCKKRTFCCLEEGINHSEAKTTQNSST